MKPDKRGFLNPVINDKKCVNCGTCVKVCPQIKRIELKPEGAIYAALAMNDRLRARSSSGGVFPLLAEYILRKGGVVFGAGLTEELIVKHVMIQQLPKIQLLQGSKYVQSEIGNTFNVVKNLLDEGQYILFSGTPCQVAGLYGFLGKDYKNLLTVDILCHGVPSPAVFKKFVLDKEAKTSSRVINVNFRDKDPGWSGFSTKIEYGNGHKEIDNSFYYLFVRNYTLRNSCYNCLYSQSRRVGDITLGDFWGYKEGKRDCIENDDLGISFVSINSAKGINSIKKIKRALDLTERTIEDATKGNPILEKACDPHINTESFWLDFEILQWDELIEKYNIPRDKKRDHISAEDRRYYSIPYKQRHRRHKIHCAKVHIISKLKNQEETQ